MLIDAKGLFQKVFPLVKSILLPGLSLIISSMVLFLDSVVLCDGSSDKPSTDEKVQPKPLVVILVCVVILCSFLLVASVVTPDNLSSAESTEVITYTLVQLPDPGSEESRAAKREFRDFLKLMGKSLGDSDSSDGEK